MLDEGLIRHSSSQWSSLLNLVQKNDGSWRSLPSQPADSGGQNILFPTWRTWLLDWTAAPYLASWICSKDISRFLWPQLT